MYISGHHPLLEIIHHHAPSGVFWAVPKYCGGGVGIDSIDYFRFCTTFLYLIFTIYLWMLTQTGCLLRFYPNLGAPSELWENLNIIPLLETIHHHPSDDFWSVPKYWGRSEVLTQIGFPPKVLPKSGYPPLDYEKIWTSSLSLKSSTTIHPSEDFWAVPK